MPGCKSLIRRYYAEVWNAWSAPALEELISADIVFRGSIGAVVNGIAEFKQYVNRIRAVFPDFHNHIEELIAEDERSRPGSPTPELIEENCLVYPPPETELPTREWLSSNLKSAKS